MIEFMAKYRQRCRFQAGAEAIIQDYAKQPRNTSPRILPSYRDDYTDDTRTMVAEKDRLIVNLFRYGFEKLAS
jgi:hypothetical protein